MGNSVNVRLGNNGGVHTPRTGLVRGACRAGPTSRQRAWRAPHEVYENVGIAVRIRSERVYGFARNPHRVPRRVGLLALAVCPFHLGSARQDAGAPSPLQLKRLSMAGRSLTSPTAQTAQLVFQMHPGAYNDESLIELLTEMHVLLKDRRVTLIWDGLPSHRSRRMREWLATQRS